MSGFAIVRNIVIYVLYPKQCICGRRGVPGVGNCLFLRARGWGIDRQVRTKLQIPGGMPGGGMVTGRIEPCINVCYECLVRHIGYLPRIFRKPAESESRS